MLNSNLDHINVKDKFHLIFKFRRGKNGETGFLHGEKPATKSCIRNGNDFVEAGNSCVAERRAVVVIVVAGG